LRTAGKSTKSSPPTSSSGGVNVSPWVWPHKITHWILERHRPLILLPNLLTLNSHPHKSWSSSCCSLVIWVSILQSQYQLQRTVNFETISPLLQLSSGSSASSDVFYLWISPSFSIRYWSWELINKNISSELNIQICVISSIYCIWSQTI